MDRAEGFVFSVPGIVSRLHSMRPGRFFQRGSDSPNPPEAPPSGRLETGRLDELAGPRGSGDTSGLGLFSVDSMTSGTTRRHTTPGAGAVDSPTPGTGSEAAKMPERTSAGVAAGISPGVVDGGGEAGARSARRNGVPALALTALGPRGILPVTGPVRVAGSDSDSGSGLGSGPMPWGPGGTGAGPKTGLLSGKAGTVSSTGTPVSAATRPVCDCVNDCGTDEVTPETPGLPGLRSPDGRGGREGTRPEDSPTREVGVLREEAADRGTSAPGTSGISRRESEGTVSDSESEALDSTIGSVPGTVTPVDVTATGTAGGVGSRSSAGTGSGSGSGGGTRPVAGQEVGMGTGIERDSWILSDEAGSGDGIATDRKPAGFLGSGASDRNARPGLASAPGARPAVGFGRGARGARGSSSPVVGSGGASGTGIPPGTKDSPGALESSSSPKEAVGGGVSSPAAGRTATGGTVPSAGRVVRRMASVPERPDGFISCRWTA